jgi:hypothetical protein
LRIIVCTKRDLAGALVLNQLLPRLAGCTVTVLLSDKTRPAEQTVPELVELKYLERGLPIDTLFPLIDRIGGDGGRMATLEGVARRFGVPVTQVDDINSPSAVALVEAFAPDVMVSIRFSHIFKRRVFELPRWGTYNLHPGALPRYAGLFAPFRAMVDGEDRIGCTVHRVDDGIDTGPVVGVGWLPVRSDRSLLWHVVNAYRPGLGLFLGMLDVLGGGGGVEAAPQDFAERRYGSMPDAAGFAAFRARGLRLFDPVEYAALLAEFMPEGMGVPSVGSPSVGSAGGGGDGGGGPCFYARA